jgi:hypothetical protein
MNAQEAMHVLEEVYHGLGFSWQEPKSRRANAQYKFTRKPYQNQWLTAVIWTAVTKTGVLPNTKTPIQTIVFGNKLPDRYVWMFSETKRFRKNKVRCAKRLHKRARLAAELTDSVVQCPSHPGPLPLRVASDQLAWVCIAPECTHRGYVPKTLSAQVRSQTPKSFWCSRTL